MPFLPGLTLNECYYTEIVGPLMKQFDASLCYSASLIGYGSDVLGYDNATSMDHNWGPRMQIFVGKSAAGRMEEIKAYLRAHLPGEFMGFSTHFSAKGPDGTQHMEPHLSGEVNHLIEVYEIDAYFAELLHRDVAQLTCLDWLCIPEQRLVELTRGRVFHDGLGRLNAMRSTLRYYPLDVKLIKLAAYWTCVSNEEAFVGRAVEFGDLVGLKLLAGRLVNMMLKICFELKEVYTPYSKWFSRAFDELGLPEIKAQALEVLTGNEPAVIERKLSDLYLAVLAPQNACAGVPRVERAISNYYNRPYKVVMAGEIVNGLRAAITDEGLKGIDLTLIGLDNKLDSSDFTNADVLGKILRD
ncbi:MAG: hypothetical protein CVU42_08665 [Chloroflexi bacterium HGW-Chloroflexi-4]|jgi:hypothetical protein|nr:MAG: hypothetical protein CVU42_08665 [Chloroflexi bacterium HGW-Chloroflexi-4]